MVVVLPVTKIPNAVQCHFKLQCQQAKTLAGISQSDSCSKNIPQSSKVSKTFQNWIKIVVLKKQLIQVQFAYESDHPNHANDHPNPSKKKKVPAPVRSRAFLRVFHAPPFLESSKTWWVLVISLKLDISNTSKIPLRVSKGRKTNPCSTSDPFLFLFGIKRCGGHFFTKLPR
jgi:hypothetical protein